MNITDFFISSFLSSVLSVIFCLTFAIVSTTALSRFIRLDDPFARAVSFFTGLGIMSWAVLMLCIVGYKIALLLKLFFWATIIAGVTIVIVKRKLSLPTFPDFQKKASLINKFSYVTLGFVVICCLIFALAPPTDYDSLDYHLGVPIEILKNGSVFFDKNQLHFRLFGLGEMINLLGIANGCPQLGAVIQITAMVYFISMLTSIVEDNRQITALMIFFGIPVLLFLIPSQKHQLTGALCTTVCFYVLAFRSSDLKGPLLFCLFICLGFSIGLKYSFIISAGVLLLGLLLKKRHLLFWPGTLLMFGAGFVLLVAPLLILKFLRYNDPLSPVLEGWFGDADPVIKGFRSMLQRYQDSELVFPLSLFIPSSPGTISTILGIGVGITILSIVGKNYRTDRLLIGLCFVLLVIGGQRTSRFFLEPLLWSVPLFLQSTQAFIYRVTVALGKLQFAALVPFYGFGAWLFAPSILSDEKREALLLKSAAQYTEAKWVNDILPPDAVVASDVRSRSFLSHRFFPLEYMVYWRPVDSSHFRRMDSMVYKEYNVEYLILQDDTLFNAFRQRYAGEAIIVDKEFIKATRNPFNMVPYKVTLYRVKEYQP